ncbi:hypothetical protein [Spongiactinospora sp. TRM90649]|uniref:hypothetical protein n=1 Tax=Spongiactinospora sp. TRM90649 TaxID=3031114 RepID=UPI0023F9C29A|nr:hypothetical protein [Spongiactinospora sp. TRM90649]MDF5755428.1 hypothetical protein [Spongiactinospora sp. TRM90649]
MPCYRCGARQTDPVRGASPWRRGVSAETQVLICPDCQGAQDLRLDTCETCGSTHLICRLGEVECRACGAVRPAAPPAAEPAAADPPPGLSAEVEAALNRVLGRR